MHFSHNLRAELRGYYDLLVYKLSSTTAATTTTPTIITTTTTTATTTTTITTATTTTTTTGVSQQNHCETSTSRQPVVAGGFPRPPRNTSKGLGLPDLSIPGNNGGGAAFAAVSGWNA